MLNRRETISKLNHFGSGKTPCLFVISFNMDQNLVLSGDELEKSGIQFKIANHTHISSLEEPAAPLNIYFKKFPVTKKEFTSSFNVVKKHLNRGNSYLANLTFPTKIETNLSLENIFQKAEAPNKLIVPGQFVVFSPELFVCVNNGKIWSFPMKGTINASIPNAASKILKDPKEEAEHFTIVDLLRNDLGMISNDVSVEAFRTISKIHTRKKDLLQVSSTIRGSIQPDFFDHLGTHMFRMLPAGSISGAPKKKTLEIISEAETYERGYYTGIFGYFDGQSMDSAVMIRFIEQTKEGMVYKSGGGITALSDADNEYQELIDKVYVPIP